MKNFSKVQIVRLLGITVLVTMIGTSLTACKQLTSEPSQFTVTFNAAGGIPGPEEQTISDGSKAIEPAAMTKEGYTFGGWYKEAAFTNAWNFETDTVTANITLYAKWEQNFPGTFSVSFTANSGTPAPAIQHIADGSKAIEPAAMTRDGYTFAGWYREDTLTTAWNFEMDTVTANITLYAKWEENPSGTFSVSFRANNGTPAPAIQYIADGGTVAEPAAMTRDGYTFAGWYREDTLTTAWNFEMDTVTANITLYAKWEENPSGTFSVSFRANNGTPAPAIQYIVDGGTVTEPAAMTREGYTFTGWYREDIFTTTWNFETDTITANTILYAKWEELALTPSDRFEYYWIDQHDSLVTTSGGETTVLLGETLNITTQETDYTVQQWYLNGVSTGQSEASYTFSSTISGQHTIGLFVEMNGKLYNTNITITVISESIQRTIKIDMYDSYGDGWNHSGALSIDVNGITTSARVNSGSSYYNTYSFPVVTGDIVNVYWTGATGNDHSENAFIMYYTDNPPVPQFSSGTTAPSSWNGSNALLFRVTNSLSNADLNQLLGSFTVQ